MDTEQTSTETPPAARQLTIRAHRFIDPERWAFLVERQIEPNRMELFYVDQEAPNERIAERRGRAWLATYRSSSTAERRRMLGWRAT